MERPEGVLQIKDFSVRREGAVSNGLGQGKEWDGPALQQRHDGGGRRVFVLRHRDLRVCVSKCKAANAE